MKALWANDAQEMVQKPGDGIVTPGISLGYMPPQLVKVSTWHKDKQSLTQTSWQKLEMTRVTMLCLGEVNRVQSSNPSRMKHISILDVKTNGALKVKRCTLVITN